MDDPIIQWDGTHPFPPATVIRYGVLASGALCQRRPDGSWFLLGGGDAWEIKETLGALAREIVALKARLGE